METNYFSDRFKSINTRLILFLMLSCFAFLGGCGSNASTDITAGLVYDERDNSWTTEDEELEALANIMKRECSKSPEIKGSYILGTDDDIIFIGGINSADISGKKVDAFTTYEIGSITKMFTATAIFQLCEQLISISRNSNTEKI